MYPPVDMPKDTPSTRRPASRLVPRPMPRLVKHIHALWGVAARTLAELAPKGLYARALIIIIAPIVLLESVVAFTFMERHWNQVTRRLSEGVARDMAAIVDLYESSTSKDEDRKSTRLNSSHTVISYAVFC